MLVLSVVVVVNVVLGISDVDVLVVVVAVVVVLVVVILLLRSCHFVDDVLIDADLFSSLAMRIPSFDQHLWSPVEIHHEQ